MIYSRLSYIIPIPEDEEQEGAIRNMVEAIYQLDKSLVVRDALLVRSDNPAIQGILDWLSRVPDGEDLDQLEGTVLRPESRLMDTSYQVSMTHAGIEEFDMQETAETQKAQSGSGKKVSVIAECKSCGEAKKIKAKGLCFRCYDLYGKNYPAMRRQSKNANDADEPEQAVGADVQNSGHPNFTRSNPYHGGGNIPGRAKLDQNVERIVARVHEQQAKAAQAARERAL